MYWTRFDFAIPVVVSNKNSLIFNFWLTKRKTNFAVQEAHSFRRAYEYLYAGEVVVAADLVGTRGPWTAGSADHLAWPGLIFMGTASQQQEYWVCRMQVLSAKHQHFQPAGQFTKSLRYCSPAAPNNPMRLKYGSVVRAIRSLGAESAMHTFHGWSSAGRELAWRVR